MHPPSRLVLPARLPLISLAILGIILALATACDTPDGDAGTSPDAGVADEAPSAGEEASPEALTGPTDPGARALAEGVWLLTHLSEEPVTLPEGWDEPPHLAWDPREAAATGSGGCNRFGGIGFLEGERFSVQGIAATRRYCEGMMEVEEAFFAALSQGGRLIADGDILRLVAVDPETGVEGGELARFRQG